MPKMRIDKLLSNMGYGSRKEIKSDAKNGIITLNGNQIKDVSAQVDTETDEIKYMDEIVKYREYIYIMMNKPQNVVSATEDNYDETVIDLLPHELQVFEPFPVGRLDKDTEGFLLITNDGKLAHNLLSPKKHVDKTYFAKIIGSPLTEKDVLKFKKGVTFKDHSYTCLPAELEILNTNDISECKITIKEGKFHQIKRMFEAIDREVIFLKRLTMGPLKLDETLELGDFRELNEDELTLMKPYMSK